MPRREIVDKSLGAGSAAVLNPLNPPNGTISTTGNRQQQQRNVVCNKVQVIESRGKQKTVLIRVGVFAVVYFLVAITATSVTFYEWWSRDSWLKAPEPSTSPKAPSKPILQFFIIRYVVSLAAGVLAAGLIWWPNVLNIWRRLPPCKQPPHKCHPNHGVIAAVPTNVVPRCYSTGSTSPTPHQTHHLNHLNPLQHPLLRTPIVTNGHVPPVHRGYKKHRKHRKHHSGSETQV